MHVRVAILAGTRGTVDGRLQSLFRSVSVLVHAGSIGGEETLAELKGVVPGATVIAVRAPDEHGPLAVRLPLDGHVDIQGVRVIASYHASTVEEALASRPEAARSRVVVIGAPAPPTASVQRDGRLWIHPGDAGGSRERTAAVLQIREKEVVLRIHSLSDDRLPLVVEQRLPLGPYVLAAPGEASTLPAK